MMVRRYILDGKTPVPCDDEAQWNRWFAANFNSRHVAVTEAKTASVSTVFLGIAIERDELPPRCSRPSSSVARMTATAAAAPHGPKQRRSTPWRWQARR